MSERQPLDVLRAIRNSVLPAYEKHTLIALVLRADNVTSATNAALSTLAHDTSLSRDTVRRALDDLCLRGLIRIDERHLPEFGQASNHHALLLDGFVEEHVSNDARSKVSHHPVSGKDSYYSAKNLATYRKLFLTFGTVLAEVWGLPKPLDPPVMNSDEGKSFVAGGQVAQWLLDKCVHPFAVAVVGGRDPKACKAKPCAEWLAWLKAKQPPTWPLPPPAG